MNISRLTPDQHAALTAQIKRMQTYLERLRARLDQRRFADDDELLLATVRAYRAIGDLSAYLHFHPPHRGPEGSDLPFQPPTLYSSAIFAGRHRIPSG